MRNILRYSAVPVGTICAVLAVTIGLVSSVAISHANASGGANQGGRLITIHDRGEERVILTKADSVQKVLQEADVNLDANDTIEPAISEELVASSYDINIYRARPVIVADGHIRQKVMTPYQTADKIAEHAGLELQDEDNTTLRPTDDIVSEGAGLELVIERATPFTLVLYGAATQAFTQSKTVEDMLESKKIHLGANDTLSVDKSVPIVEGMTVEIWRNGTQTITEEQAIPFDVEQVKDVDRDVGFREIKTPGVVGKKSVTYEVEMKNGQELSRKEIQNVVLEQPKKQVETIGAKVKTFGGSCDEWMAGAGITDIANATYLINRESRCNPHAVNKSSGACGIGQALPCSKMNCEMGDGACQMKWMNSYVMGRYGSWEAAADHSRRVGWY